MSAPNRRLLILGAKLAVTFGAIAFLLVRQPVADLGAAIATISPSALLTAVAVQLCAVGVGTVRWRVLLTAYGASYIPPFPQLIKVYLVGQFYNVFVPGAVGGDVLRGVVTRRSFGGATGAVAVVFVERALGAAGLLALTAVSTALFALDRFAYLLPICALGVAAVAAGVVTLANGARLARYAPGPLRSMLSALPPLERRGAFAVASLLSLATQSLVAVCGHVLAHSLDPKLSLADSFVAMPIAAAAGYFPFSWAGIGPRDMLVKSLYERLGASPAIASATAFSYLAATLMSGAVGGLVQLVRPLSVDDAPDK